MLSRIRHGSLIVLLLMTFAAQAQIRVEIVEGQERRTQIAVVPFGGAQGVPFDLATVVGADLQNSGKFDALERKDMGGMQLPTQGVEIRFQDWRALNAEYIVVGSLKPEGTRYRADFGLYNVLTGQMMLEKSVPADAASWRRSAHAIADQVFEKITGVRGVFSTRIAYVRVEGNPPKQAYKLIVADYDGENSTDIAKSTEPIMSPAWSPDGQSLAYVSFENKVSAIFVQTLRSGERRQVSARSGINGAPAWSPDGKAIALTLSRKDGDVDVYTLELATQLLTRMTFDPGIDTEPVWSLDGRKLYFSSDRAGAPQIYEVDVAQPDRATRVTFEGTYNARPRLSPDGKRLATVHLDRGNFRIAISDTGTKVLQVLTQGKQDESPSFAPNGDMLIYATQEKGRGVLANVTTDGRNGPRLLDAGGGDIREPVWAPFVTK